jgi:hypothetical protein
MLTVGVLKMFDPQISMDIPNAISLQGSADGHTLLGWQAGPTQDKCGRGAAPANLSARQAKAAGLLTSGTYGHHSSISLNSANLDLSLENRLPLKMGWLGSILYSMTWKERITPQGRVIHALRALGLRTLDKDFTGWPTTFAADGNGGRIPKDATLKVRPSGAKVCQTLNASASLCGWPTPNLPSGGPNVKSSPTHRGGMDLEGAATLAGWITPQTHDTTTRGNTNADHHYSPHDLSNQVLLAGWPTCAARDYKSNQSSEEFQNKQWEHPRGKPLSALATLATPQRLTMHGKLLTGSDAQMTSGGPLNPAHSRWLMGYPKEWDVCADMVTLSSPNKRRK